jgi:hypothetical protein
MLFMEKPKGLIASGIWLLAMVLGPPVLGATFDAKLEAPRAESARSLESQLQAHFDTFRKKSEGADPAAFIRDAAAHQRWTDLRFALIRAMEEGVPLDDLSAVGLSVEPDKTYTVDLQKFPEWQPLDAQLKVLNNADGLEYFIPSLVARGFRDGDVEILRNYVATHDARLIMSLQGKPLVNGVAKRLQAQRQAAQPLDLDTIWRSASEKQCDFRGRTAMGNRPPRCARSTVSAHSGVLSGGNSVEDDVRHRFRAARSGA